MMKYSYLFFLAVCFSLTANLSHAQYGQPLSYYLPESDYNPEIPTPAEVLGFEIGEWHLSHDQLVFYMRQLATSSDRVRLFSHGRTHENRPLIHLVITSEKNQQRLDEIKAQRDTWTQADSKKLPNAEKMPAVVYQGYSIHGNEASGSNAAPLVAYYLAAAQDPQLQRLLDDVVIILDPCFNPDGLNRFASWVNTHRSLTPVSDPQSREFSEAWPRGRTNHYWFDLNRDWLLAQHPESQGRLNIFHDWHPNILTDHHEMGSNSTFFFQPGVPERTNPLTPPQNQELTARIGTYHAEGLDAIGSLYYSQETFDDFYYGKGSTYPDVQGSIGILFEQASSRGHLQETVNGPLSFAFAIRNQVTTSLSTLKAAKEMRIDLLNYQRDFFIKAAKEAQSDDIKAYVFTAGNDIGRANHLFELLNRHQVKIYRPNQDLEAANQSFPKEQSFIVPLEQPQYKLIKAVFESATVFRDSLFYDVSTWTLPLAFNLQYAPLTKKTFKEKMLYDRILPFTNYKPELDLKRGAYGYLLSWHEYAAPQALYMLHQKGIRMKVATEPFQVNSEKVFKRGTVFIPALQSGISKQDLHQLIEQVSQETSVPFHSVNSGQTPVGIDLGSPTLRSLQKPKVALLVGGGVSSYEAGEVWHLLDQRYRIPATQLEVEDLSRADLDRYNVLIMVNGNYSISEPGKQQLRAWVQGGGTLIATKGGAEWAITHKLAPLRIRKKSKNGRFGNSRPYAFLREDRGTDVIGGAIMQAKLDLTHPLAFGYEAETIPIFQNGTLFLEPAKNPYATPLKFTEDPLLSGYVSDWNLEQISEAAAIAVAGQGRGKVICFNHNPNFRAFWYGTNKLFANAIFFGDIIDRRATEREE